MSKKLSLSLAIGAMLTCGLCAAQQASFTDGQAVEVREGDTWSAATVQKKEGRKYSVRYKDSADEEWVTADRLRAASGALDAGNAAATPGTPAAPAAPADAAKPKMPWTLAQSVEVKRGAQWKAAIIFKIENGWVQVLYQQGNFREWVEPTRIRKVGSKEDTAGPAPLHKPAEAGDPPPKDPPADPRAATAAKPGAPAAAGYSGWREPAVGDRVQVLTSFGIKVGRLLQKGPDKFLVAVEGERRNETESFNPLDVRVFGMKLDAKVGQRVQIREGMSWAPGTVVEREPERAKIKQDGWDHEMFHKWKGLDELRPPLAGDVPPADAAPEVLRSLPGYREANVSSVEDLSLIVANAGAKLAPDASTRPAGNKATVKAVPVKGAAGDPAPCAILAPTGTSSVVVVASRIDNKDNVLLDRLDMDATAPAQTVQIPVAKDMRPCGVSADGLQVLFRKGGAFDAGDRIEIWSIDPAAPKRELILFPYTTGNNFEKNVRFAALLGSDRMLLAGGKNELSVWDTKSAKAIYRCGISAGCEPAISASGRYIAFTTGKEAMIIEAATGKAVMELPQVLADAARFSFSPSGKQLVACDSHTVWSVNLDTGELYREFTLPGNITNASIDSPADGYALINDSILVDLERRLPIWKYEVPNNSAAAVLPSGQYAFAVDSDARSACNLVSTTVPHPGALKAAQGLKEGGLLLKPGASISLQMNVSCTEQERAAIMTRINSQMKDHEITIAPGQPVELVLSVEMGQSVQREYGSGPSFGPFARSGEKVTITPRISRMRIVYQGKTAWEVSTVAGDPGAMISRKRDQTMQQAVDEMAKPNLSIFTSTRLPSYLVMPANPMYLGASELSGRGLRDKKVEPEPDTPATPGGPPPGRPGGPVA